MMTWFKNIFSHRADRAENRRLPVTHAMLSVEELEQRLMLSITIQFNYSRDTNGFFTPTRKATLAAAADVYEAKLGDTLQSIIPSGGNTWSAKFTHPGTGVTETIVDLKIGANKIVVFPGARDLGSTLGRGGPGGYSASGSSAWLTRVITRGEGTRADVQNDSDNPNSRTAIEFAPWGGAITFNTESSWHNKHTITPGPMRNDLYSVALHELGHLLGFGTADSFENLVRGRQGDSIGVRRGSKLFFDYNNTYGWDGVASGDKSATFLNDSYQSIAGDWDGDGFDEVGSFTSGIFLLDSNANYEWDGVPGGDSRYVFGKAGDTAIVGDWDGDGTDDIGVRRGKSFLIDANGNHKFDGKAGGDDVFPFGGSADTPAIGDWNGDGEDDLGLRSGKRFLLDKNANNTWDGNAGGDESFIFGNASDTAVIGDWDGDGTDDVGLRRGRALIMDSNGNHKLDGAATDYRFNFLSASDTAFIGNWVDEFEGTEAVAEYDEAGSVPLSPNLHWREDLEDGGDEAAMDPTLTIGTRKELTDLDFAALDDLGWEII